MVIITANIKNMYTVFTDFHHASLLQSLILLFEKRLGGKVFRPIGMEWASQGFWKVYDHPATQAQFLGIGSATPDGSEPLNEVLGVGANINGEIGKRYEYYRCHDIDSDTENKALTFPYFMQAPIDIVIASIPQHVEPFKRLCELHPRKPKLIFQIGNAWTTEAATAPNIMASAKIANVPAGVNFIEYHQEFDTDIFRPYDKENPGAIHQNKDIDLIVDPAPHIFSFVNVFNGQEHFKHDYQLFTEVERQMPEFLFKSYGGQCRDGAVGPSSVLAERMRQARFIWHTKAGGDGYGHIIHNAFAVGRPPIVKVDYYRGKLAEPLFIDGETCIAIDNLSIGDIVEKIRHYNDPARYLRMSRAAYTQFTRLCNFDAEFDHLQHFLANLV